MSGRLLLLSVRPRFAALILAGTKTIELRRVRPRVVPGDGVLLYVSSPVMALTACSTVERVFEGSPTKLWEVVRSRAGVTRREYDEYFRGAARGAGISLGEVDRFSHAVPLSELREIWPGFHPPQSFRYLDSQAFEDMAVLTPRVAGAHVSSTIDLMASRTSP